MGEPRVRVLKRRQRHPVKRTLSGRVVAHADPDHADGASTTRIGGIDVWADLAEHYADLARPVGAELCIATRGRPDVFTSADLYLRLGFIEPCCGDGCCGGVEETRCDTKGRGDGPGDVREALDALHGQHIGLAWELRGHVEPLVVVTLAHHWEGRRPGSEVTIPLSDAKKLAYGGRLLGKQNEKVKSL